MRRYARGRSTRRGDPLKVRPEAFAIQTQSSIGAARGRSDFNEAIDLKYYAVLEMAVAKAPLGLVKRIGPAREPMLVAGAIPRRFSRAAPFLVLSSRAE